MSHKTTSEWLEAMKTEFDIAKTKGKINTALQIIQTLKEHGFKKEANTLLEELKNTYGHNTQNNNKSNE